MGVGYLLAMCLILGMLEQSVSFATLNKPLKLEPGLRADTLANSVCTHPGPARPIYNSCRPCEAIPDCENPKRDCHSPGPCEYSGLMCPCEDTKYFSEKDQACRSEDFCHEPVSGCSDDTSCFCDNTLPQLEDLRPSGAWCGGTERNADQTVCESKFRTGTNGWVYPCEHAGDKCYLSTDPFLCCKHFCDVIAGRLPGYESRTPVNPATGNGYYTGMPECSSITSGQSACEAKYWMDEDLKKYPCVWSDSACRQSLSNGCMCS